MIHKVILLPYLQNQHDSLIFKLIISFTKSQVTTKQSLKMNSIFCIITCPGADLGMGIVYGCAPGTIYLQKETFLPFAMNIKLKLLDK